MSTFSMSRAETVNASVGTVHDLLNDIRHWRDWSPWEDVDPDLERTYSGPEVGTGAHYAWSGNNKAGTGTMEIVESTPDRIVIALEFLKPFKASNKTSFQLTPSGSGTKVTWTMTGQRNALMGVMGKFYFDKAIGKDFDRGLAQLKARAER